MFNFPKKILLTIFSVLITTNLFSGLLPGTMVLVGENDYKRVEDLRVGDSIQVYNIPRHEIGEDEYKIQEIKVHKSKDIILIETDSELIPFGSNQKIYNRRIRRFIPACEFVVGDKLFSPGMGDLEIKNVVTSKLAEKIELYDISIEDGNLFIICTEDGINLLVHNFAIAVPVLIYVVLAKVAEAVVATTAIAGVAALDDHFSKKGRRKNKGRKVPGLDDIIKGAKEPKKGRKGKSDVWEKKGGEEKRDRDSADISNGEPFEDYYTDKGKVSVGRSKNGEKIVKRGFSGNISGNKPTLEIQIDKNNKIKIRYDD